MTGARARLSGGVPPRAAGLALSALLLATQAAADAPAPAPDSPHRIALELGGEVFRWQERDSAGQRLLSEHGLRWTLGGALGNGVRRTPGPLYALSARGYLGRVDYDGQDTSAFRRFVASTTDYTGVGAELAGGWRFLHPGAALAVDVVGGLGVDRWRRDIRGGTNAAGLPVTGFIEDYTVTFGRIGLGLSHEAMPNGHFTIGYRVPLRVHEDVVIDGRPIRLEPGRNPSAFLSWELSLRPGAEGERLRRHLRVYYETWRFDRSAQVQAGSLSVWQPESDMDVLGLAVGLSY